MKSLKTIQVLAKIAKIICTVLFIVCIVGASCCALSVIILPVTKDVILYEDKTFSVVLAEQGTSYIDALTGSVIGLIVCGVGIFLAKYTELFFKKELELGTPFDKGLVKDMRKMALIHIIVSIVASIITSIVYFIFKESVPDFNGTYDFNGGSIGFGISMLIISLFCDYGAEKANDVIEAEEVEETL